MNILKLIIEEVTNFLNEYTNPYSIIDLSEVISRMGIDKETALKLLQDSFRNGGDEYVVDMFYDITHIQIYPISKGKYVFSKPTGGD